MTICTSHDACPACAYNLQGHEVKCTCPECGKVLSKDDSWFVAPARHNLVGKVIRVILILWLGVGALHGAAINDRSMMFVNAVALLLVGATWSAGRRPRKFIIIGDKHLEWGTRVGPTTKVNLQRVAEVEHRPLADELWFFSREGVRIAVLGNISPHNSQDARAIVDEINKRVKEMRVLPRPLEPQQQDQEMHDRSRARKL